MTNQNEIGKIENEPVQFVISKLNVAVETLNNKGMYPKGYKDPYSKLPFDEQPQNTSLRDVLQSVTATGKSTYNINLFRIARDLVQECKPRLATIKENLGADNEIYLRLSNDVASISMACLIEYVNNNGNSLYGILPNIDEHEINAMNSIDDLEMSHELRTRYKEQRLALNNLKRNVETAQTRKSNSSSSGCYIATMAYGSYDHPQVIILRNFRDQTLSKSTLGNILISIYYRISPRLVLVLKNKTLLNSGIRWLLNNLIRFIK
jgi:hypothetical protein